MNNQQYERAFVVVGGRLQGLVLDLVREFHGDDAADALSASPTSPTDEPPLTSFHVTNHAKPAGLRPSAR